MNTVGSEGSVNDKLYIHEFIDIIGHNRANYMYHMTANWSPIAQEERHQLCYGVWGIVGSTRNWPSTVNIWEEDGFDGMAESFRHEVGRPGLQDPNLEKWWARAADFRSGGYDRLLVPAPWTRTIEQLCADKVRGEAYAHEIITTPPGGILGLLDRIAEEGEPLLNEFGWVLAGAWETAMVGDSEAILVWAIPTWEQWSEAEKAERADTKFGRWRRTFQSGLTSFQRFLMADSELNPMRLGRQPSRTDRRADWQEEPGPRRSA
ncbi:hypothetical protein ABT009_25445 [Streptomyces sp. NPDC002896]|uniref:hypothetical protein n=1 Tax=Streptomyces sp. NPDC002896 TaxID=3154438 RepID=UPI003331B79B